jgi:ribosomal protein S18 acetylase RimI-like enzyme
MRNAGRGDKELIVNILTDSFKENKSVNYIINQNSKRLHRIKGLMEYSFETCLAFGQVLLSDDNKACAVIIYPDKKRTSLKSVWLDTKLAFSCIGISNLGKAMKREAAIKKGHPAALLSYLWFIGVRPQEQGKGAGSHLLSEIIDKSKAEGRIICLETSTEKNLPWYKKFGFEIYNKLDFGYNLYCMKLE